MLRILRDGVRWEVADGLDPALLDALAAKGRVIKESPAKLVTLHHIPRGDLYVKRYRTVPAFRAAKFWFRDSQSRREWRLAGEMERRGIPVVRHLAMGERWSALGLTESILVTESFAGVPMVEFPGRNEPEVQSALGRLLRLMHDQGVLQFDLYGNILVRAEPLELRRVDVHHALLKNSLTEREKLDNLAFLDTEVPLLEAFYRAYGWDASLAARVRARSIVMRRDFCAHRARRCFRENHDFLPLRQGPLKCWVRRQFLDANLRGILAAPDAALETAQPLKRGRSATVASAHGLVIKRFNFRRASSLLKNCFRSSRAKLAFRRAYHLELAGIPTARGAAAAERRVGPVLLRSYFVMEEIPGARDLAGFAGETRLMAAKVAELLAKLHNAGFSNRDMKETNILIDCAGRPVLIDLEGLRFHSIVPDARAAADLSRLARGVSRLPNVSRAERFLFLRAYLRARGLRAGALRGVL